MKQLLAQYGGLKREIYILFIGKLVTAMGRQPACMLFSKPIDSLAAAGSILASVWLDGVAMPVVDSLGEEFLAYMKDGMSVTVLENGLVRVD